MRTLVNRRHSGPEMTALVAMQRVLMAVIVGSMALGALISGLGSRPLLSEHTLALLIFDLRAVGVGLVNRQPRALLDATTGNELRWPLVAIAEAHVFQR